MGESAENANNIHSLQLESLEMTDFPHGGNVDSARAWLDSRGFVGSFVTWDADALLGLEKPDFQELVTDEGILTKVDAVKLWSILNTARSLRQRSSGNKSCYFVFLCS